MKIIIGLFTTILFTYAWSTPMLDSDLDGVSDAKDQCPNTPFLNEVDASGCTTSILVLPNETDKEHLDISIGYGYNSNEDLIDREIQRNTKIQIGYYKNNWTYSMQAGYYSHALHRGALDTLFRVKKRIKLNSDFAFSTGVGLRFPSYKFEGNRADGVIYASLHYYSNQALSFFAGYTFIKINDKEVDPLIADPSYVGFSGKSEAYQGLQNIHKFYFGTGYFFTPHLYASILYSEEKSKFVGEHNIKQIGTSIYYKINPKWFSTITYSQEIQDKDFHNDLMLNVGYHIW